MSKTITAAFALLALLGTAASGHADQMPRDLTGRWCYIEGEDHPSQYQPCIYNYGEYEFTLHQNGSVEGQEWGCDRVRVTLLDHSRGVSGATGSYSDNTYVLDFSGCQGEGRPEKPRTWIVEYNQHQGLLWVTK
jgi:hypothetical protein